MAQELHQPLHELLGCPGPVSYRQYLAWQAWLDEQYNEPTRSDHYLMQIAREVRHSFRGGSTDLDEFKIPFKKKAAKKRKDEEDHTANLSRMAESLWFARVGTPRRAEDING